jgi:nitrous oxidase accessory protein
MIKIVRFLLTIGLLWIIPQTVFAASELQQLIEATPINGTLQLKNKTYEGNVTITKPITILGSEYTVISGDKTVNVIEIKSTGVHIEGITVTNSGMGRNTGEEYAAIKLFEGNNVLKRITISNSFHGIYLSQSHGNDISDIHVTGQHNGEIAGQGNGLHLYYSNDNTLTDNTISGTRDGIFFDYSNRNTVTESDLSRTRYGLHFMYSNDNRFENNRFTYNTAGAAVMFSHSNVLSENEFSLNQGSRSFGLMLQSSDDNLIKNNYFYQNLRGLYIDQSHDNRIEQNEMIQNQIGVELWASSSKQVFIENRFSRNVAAVLSLGGRSNNQWNENQRGNDWGSSIPLLDLNQDGIGDYPVQYTSALYKLVEDNELTALFLKSPAIRIYEKMSQVLNQDQVMMMDEYPLTRQRATTNFLGILAYPFSAGILVALFVAMKRRYKK